MMGWGNPWAEEMLSAKQIAGKTIESTEVVTALYGTTPKGLLLLRFTDGSRAVVLLTSSGGAEIVKHARMIDSAGMRKAPLFFTEDEVAAEVVREMQWEKQQKLQARANKEREIARLQKELTDA